MRFLPIGKTGLVMLICLATLLGARYFRLEDPNPLPALRNLTFDLYQRLKPREKTDFAIKIVDIDQPSLQALGQWPWPRTKIAELIEKLHQSGASVIALDMIFSEPDRTSPSAVARQFGESTPGYDELSKILADLPDNDDVLAQSLNSVNSVLAFFVNGPQSTSDLKPKANVVISGDDPTTILPSIQSLDTSLPPMVEASLGHGVANIILDERSDVIRKYQLFYADPNGPVTQNLYPAFGLEVLRIALNQSGYVVKNTAGAGEIAGETLAMTAARIGDFEVPLTGEGALQLYFSKDRPERYLSAKSVFELSPEDLAKQVSGHIIFIGTSAAGLRDLRTNALGETVPGVTIHAEIVDQILAQKFISRPDWAIGVEITIMIVLALLIMLVLPYVGALAAALFGALLSATVLAGSWYAFSIHGLLIDPVFPMLTGAVIYLLATILLFAFAEKEKRFVRMAFQRYLAPNLLLKLESSPDALKLGGEIREMTLMFMDIRGFTPISEKLAPEELVAFLNTLLSPLSDDIQTHEGAIDKYIGDSIMAFWNAPLAVDDHPRKAVTAGLKMLQTVQRLNDDDAFGFHDEKLALGNVEIGIGLNTGDGCVGNMGSDSRFDYSVIGDTVNIASRIESSCKSVGWPLLISKETAQRCRDFALLEAGAIPLKGKSEPQILFAVIGDEAFGSSSEFKELEDLHGQLLNAILQSAPKKRVTNLRKAYLAAAPNAMHDFIEKLGGGIEIKPGKK